MAIPSTILTNHHIGNSVEDITTSIDVEDFPFLAEMMNGLYSDPIAAVLREYATNSHDSHVEAGVTRPIEITLPNPFSPQLVIQDFGVGMSVDDLRKTYSKYGRSDKRDSNAVAGQLGMGSKSGLSYAPSFTITAIKGGVKVIAIFTKNEAGLGVIKVLNTRGTNDSNGVTITIPVENKDIAAFGEKAERLFSFWESGTVLVNGKSPATPKWADGALWLDTERYTALVRPDTLSRSYVVMGNVPYPVADAVRYDKNGNPHYRRFVARLNIGDVDFTPSREEVKLTNHTKQTLSELGEYIFASYDNAFAKALAQTTTPWEEMQLKVSWAESRKAPKLQGSTDVPIWTYDPNAGYGRKAATKNLEYQFKSLLNDRIVITGFPFRVISPDARARICTFAPTKGTYVICTTGVTGVSHLEGRDNVVRYDDVLAATAPIKGASTKAARAPKVETRYTVRTSYNGGTQQSLTAAEIAKLAEDHTLTVLYLDTNVKLGGFAAVFDGNTHVVCLYSSAQLPRIQRFVPSIRSVYDEYTTRRQAIVDSVTAYDRELVYTRAHLKSVFASLRADRINDSDLARYVALYNAADTDTMKDAKAFNVAIETVGVAPKVMPNFLKRYPLANQVYSGVNSEDMLLYVNAKHHDHRTKAVAKAAEAALLCANITDQFAEVAA